MRLTTRLMQVASWLLVQRAIREGDMDAREACLSRYRLGAQSVCQAEPAECLEEMPAALIYLLERSSRLYERVLHLDRRMFLDAPAVEGAHPVRSQLERLQAAFGR